MRQRLNRGSLARYVRLVEKYERRGLLWREANDCAARRMGWGGYENELRWAMIRRSMKVWGRVWPKIRELATAQDMYKLGDVLIAGLASGLRSVREAKLGIDKEARTG